MKPALHPMLLDGETALLLRRGLKCQRRWPLPDGRRLPDMFEGQSYRWPALPELKDDGTTTGRWGWVDTPVTPDARGEFTPAPVSGPGTLLYVRESFALVGDATADVAKALGIAVAEHPAGLFAVAKSAVVVRQVGADPDGPIVIGSYPVARWGSAIHMPSWAATQFLRVEALYMHRLQVLEWPEAVAEGVNIPGDAAATLAAFVPFWDRRNPGAKWEANPMVAAVAWTPITREEALGEQPAEGPKGKGKGAAKPKTGRSRARGDGDGAAAGAARAPAGGQGEGGSGGEDVGGGPGGV